MRKQPCLFIKERLPKARRLGFHSQDIPSVFVSPGLMEGSSPSSAVPVCTSALAAQPPAVLPIERFPSVIARRRTQNCLSETRGTDSVAEATSERGRRVWTLSSAAKPRQKHPPLGILTRSGGIEGPLATGTLATSKDQRAQKPSTFRVEAGVVGTASAGRPVSRFQLFPPPNF